jgi:hypothetical protein
MKVSFMVVGVQKGGTSALYQYLRKHPEIGMPSRKECHYFDRENRNWESPNYDTLHELYEPGRDVYGESTPITIYWTSAHERIRAYNPDMSFILLVRDPIERAYSHWCMLHARGTEQLSFQEAIREGRQRNENAPRKYNYLERGLYAEQVEVLRRTFPDAQILYLLSEELLENHRRSLRRVAKFLGVDSRRFPARALVANTKEPIAYPSVITSEDRDYLREYYAADVEKFAGISGLDIGRWKSFADCSRGLPAEIRRRWRNSNGRSKPAGERAISVRNSKGSGQGG